MTAALRRAVAIVVARIRAGHPLEVGQVERDAVKAGVDPGDLAREVSATYSEEYHDMHPRTT